ADTDSSPGSAGSFSYTAADGDGSYSFYTVATDKAGNVAGSPSGDADSTLLDTGKPTSAASVPDYETSASFSVSYVAADPGAASSALDKVELYVDTPAAGGYALAATDSGAGIDNSFSYSATDGDGAYSFYTKAYDLAGNVEVSPVSDADSTPLDTAKPTSSASVPDYETSASFAVSYVAADPGAAASALDKVELYVDTPAAGGYALAATDSGAGIDNSFSYSATDG